MLLVPLIPHILPHLIYLLRNARCKEALSSVMSLPITERYATETAENYRKALKEKLAQ
jgi:hypothetical protein